MQPAYEIPAFIASRSSIAAIAADLVAIPLYQDERDAAHFVAVDTATGQQLADAAARGEFTGKPYELWPAQAPAWGTKRVLLVGAGKRQDYDAERARRIGSAIAIAARQQRHTRVAIAIGDGPLLELADSLVEGVVVGNFDTGFRKSKRDDRFLIGHVELAADGDCQSALARGIRIGEAVNAARVLVNEPGNHLTPREFVARGQALLSLPDVATEILDERQMEALGMGMLLGVARGSAEPPRMLVARYTPADAPASPVLGLIGKGITFDTGGISIKPADGMERMKDDMAGGATVIAALRAIALEKLPIRVVCIVPSTENMPSGTATKPGDVHTSAAGLTVEVNNTDAEGRLILGDALWHARQLGATHLVDVATLTGACIVALGKITTGLFATDGWTEVLLDAARRGGEKLWAMPIYEEYREALKSEIADMLNSPGRAGGAITAAMFLKEFVGETPWAHLDIAGTAWAEDARPWTAKGATGAMTRTLVEVARSAGQGWP